MNPAQTLSALTRASSGRSSGRVQLRAGNNRATRAILCSLRRRVAERSVGGWRPDRVCSSVCLHDAFHVPRISLPFISPPPPLCRFRVRVQPASRISLQLVLVQILIPKGWLGRWWGWRRLTNLASEKTRGRSRREESRGGAGVLLQGGRSSPCCLPHN